MIRPLDKYRLKIKIKSLAEEARIIRKEENKLKDKYRSFKPEYTPATKLSDITNIRECLYAHRVVNVRTELRHANLAYAYLRGRAYRQIEPKAHTVPSVSRLTKLILTFGPSMKDKVVLIKELNDWLNAPYQLEVPLSCKKVSIEMETV